MSWSVYFNLAIIFHSWCQQFYHQLKLDSFTFHIDENGKYAMIRHKIQQKTHQGGLEIVENSGYVFFWQWRNLHIPNDYPKKAFYFLNISRFSFGGICVGRQGCSIVCHKGRVEIENLLFFMDLSFFIKQQLPFVDSPSENRQTPEFSPLTVTGKNNLF